MLCLITPEAGSFVIPRGNANPVDKEYEKADLTRAQPKSLQVKTTTN